MEEMEEIVSEVLRRGLSPDLSQVNFSEHSFTLVYDVP
jgi:hypothetical protein